MLVDTNVLIRMVTKHPEAMYRAARTYLEAAENLGQRLTVHPVHVTEALFVLEGRVYGLKAAEAAGEMRQLLSMEVLEVIDGPAVMEALRRYPASGVNFPDVLLAELARMRSTGVVSFDRGLMRLGVQVVVPGEKLAGGCG